MFAAKSSDIQRSNGTVDKRTASNRVDPNNTWNAVTNPNGTMSTDNPYGFNPDYVVEGGLNLPDSSYYDGWTENGAPGVGSNTSELNFDAFWNDTVASIETGFEWLNGGLAYPSLTLQQELGDLKERGFWDYGVDTVKSIYDGMQTVKDGVTEFLMKEYLTAQVEGSNYSLLAGVLDEVSGPVAAFHNRQVDLLSQDKGFEAGLEAGPFVWSLAPLAAGKAGLLDDVLDLDMRLDAPERISLDSIGVPDSAIALRQLENAKLRASPQFIDDMNRVGVTPAQIEAMFAKKMPLGFQSEKQFAQFKSELDVAMSRSGLGSGEVGLKGTATTFYSENPGKALGHHWDATPSALGDYDLNITSSVMVNTLQKSGLSPHPKYNVFRTADINSSFPELNLFQQKWTTTLGRDVNFVGYPAPQARDLTEYVLK
jgi:hypothetical protein